MEKARAMTLCLKALNPAIYERRAKFVCGAPGLLSWRATLAALAVCVAAGPSFPNELTHASLVAGSGEQTAIAAPVDSSEGYRLDSEDRVRVRFYDRYDRDDLNGEYIINERGQLRLPRIGLFKARGLQTEELEKTIRASVENNGEKLGFFSIEVVQCRPFYIAGLVNRPGSYPFVPGFTVLHAVAVAGGLHRSPDASATEALREKRTLTETIDRLLATIARRERLKAERDAAATIPSPAEITSIDRARGEELIASEKTVLLRQREVYKREEDRLKELISTNTKEADRYNGEVARIDKRVDEQSEIFMQLKKLHEDKIINQQRFLESVNALDAVQRDKQNAIAGLSRARADLEKAGHDLSMLAVNRNARIAQETAETEREISRLKMTAAKTKQLISTLDAFAGASGSSERATYKIMRRNGSGQFVFIPATEITPVMPGDVIEIESQVATSIIGGLASE
jgi:protein involved in polysaccharide export with SLBB domain